jgi:hypothetical protein
MEDQQRFKLIVFLVIALIVGLIFLYLFLTTKSGKLNRRWWMFTFLFVLIFSLVGFYCGFEGVGRSIPTLKEYLVIQIASLLLGAVVISYALRRLKESSTLSPWTIFYFLMFVAFLGLIGFTAVYHFIESGKFNGGLNYLLFSSAFLPFLIPFLILRTVDLRIQYEEAYQAPEKYRFYIPEVNNISAEDWDGRNVVQKLEFKLFPSLFKKTFSFIFNLVYVRPNIAPKDKSIGEVFAYSVFEANKDYEKSKNKEYIKDLIFPKFRSNNRIYWIFVKKEPGGKCLLIPSESLERNDLRDKDTIYADRRVEL